jgi:hypothetical protein
MSTSDANKGTSAKYRRDASHSRDVNKNKKLQNATQQREC